MTDTVRRATAVGAGAGAAILVVVLMALGLVGGPVGWAIFLVGVLLLPSSRSLSRRFAYNIAIVIGFVPLLWWAPWPAVLPGRGAVITGIVVGVVVFLAVGVPSVRTLVLPRLRLTDAIVGATALVNGFVFAPYLVGPTATQSVAMLTRATGGDNVAHFDIFEMIRRTGIATWWPAPAGSDSSFAYTTYPQHFHVLAAFGAELWGGPAIQPVGIEAGLYGLGTTFALSLATTAVVAGVVSLGDIRRRFVIALPAAAAIVSFLILGFGSTINSYGFPNFMLGVAVTALAPLLVVSSARTRLVGLIAVAATVVTAAHTWSLLAPLAAVALLVALVRMPWRDDRARLVRVAAPALVVALTAACSVYAVVLVLLSTRSAGTPAQALEIPGAVPTNPVPLTLACLLAVILLGAWLVVQAQSSGRPRTEAGILGLMAVLIGAVGGAMSLGLIVLQLRRVQGLGYYQFKFLDGMVLIAAVVGVAVVATLVKRLASESTRRTDLVSGAFAAGAALAVVLVSGLPFEPHPAFASYLLPAITNERALVAAQSANQVDVDDLRAAASVMATKPCARPVYIPELKRDLFPDLENTWAMALSGTWTLDAQDANSLLFTARTTRTHTPSLTAVARDILATGADRCVIVAPELVALLSSLDVSRVSTWTVTP